MKKLLVLMLVLGLASAANATVSLSIDGVNPTDGTEDIDITISSTITLSILSDDDQPWMMEVSVLTADATLGAPSVTAAAGGLAKYTDYSDATLWDYEIITGGVEPDYPTAGVQWTMSLTALGALDDVFTVDLGPYGGAVVSSIDFTLIPEPMTIALLGLGSLFLLRRRK